jgi:ketosteroid isomerase-like protein
MKRYLLALAIAVTLASPVFTAVAETENAETRQVNDTFDRYVLGWKNGDLHLLGEVYANNARLTAYWPDPSRGSRLSGWSQIHDELKDVFDRIHGMDLDFNERQIDIYGRCAVLTTQWTWHHPADPIFATGRATFIFNKQGHRWVLVHEHSSVTPFIPGEVTEPRSVAEVPH